MDIPSLVVSALGSLLSFTAVTYTLSQGRYRNPYDIAYLNLTVSDLLLAFRKFLDTIFCELPVRDDAPYACRVSYFVLARILWNTNLFSIFPIVFDRYMAVIHPTRYKTPTHKVINAILITSCWAFSLGWWVTQFYFVMNPTLSYAQADIFLKKVTWYLEAFIFMVLPTIVNVASFGLIIYTIQKRVNHQTITIIITVIKALLCTIVFTMTWFPLAYTAVTEGVARLHVFVYLNTISDPFIYLLPNTYVRKLLQRARFVLSLEETRATSTMK